MEAPSVPTSLKRPIRPLDPGESTGFSGKRPKIGVLHASIGSGPNNGPGASSGIIFDVFHLQSSAHTTDNSTFGMTFAHYLSDEQKSRTLQHMLQNASTTSLPRVIAIGKDHNLPRKNKELLLADLRAHSCTWACLVRTCDALEAEQLVTPAPVYHQTAASCTERRDEAAVGDIDMLAEDEAFWAKSWPLMETEESLKDVRSLQPRIVPFSLPYS
jgi:hypothetical protein